MTNEEHDIERIQAALDILSEHYDAVHIFASRHEPEVEDGTVSVNKGVGNWYARNGQVREWILKQDEYTKINCRKEDE